MQMIWNQCGLLFLCAAGGVCCYCQKWKNRVSVLLAPSAFGTFSAPK